MTSEQFRPVAVAAAAVLAVVSSVIGFQAWADGEFVTKEEQVQYKAEQKVLHSKQFLSQSVSYHETRLKMSELELEYLEEKETLTSSENRKLGYLKNKALFHNGELEKMRKLQAVPEPEK